MTRKHFAFCAKSYTEAFLQFINDETFSVQGDYQKTWEFIMENGNSLKRYTNLAVFFYRLGIGIK